MYLDLLSLFSIPTLGDHRLYLSLFTMYKIVINLLISLKMFLFQSHQPIFDHLVGLSIVQPFARTNSLKFSLISHTCSIWNTLPNYITGGESLMAFKRLLQNYILSF